MNNIEQKKQAKAFVERWTGKGYEKGESQRYWIDLLSNVLGVQNATEFIEFEDQVHIDKATGFIDAYIPSTKIMIEQKSIDKDLKKAVKQSDGSLLNPFQQALRYANELNNDDRPRWIITCNFKSMLIYDLNNRNAGYEEILLKDLPKEYYRLSFIVDSKNEHIKKEEELSFKAGELVGKLYDAFSKQYRDLTNEQSQKDLNELCVRLVFCLYAEDAGLFGRKNVFHDYLSKYEDLSLMRQNLIKLFQVLDTPIDKRDPYLEEELNQFPYVNGGLFSNENIEIPSFTEEIKNTLLAKASDEFDWSEISPTIFGAVFESTLNPETRRSGGMHYTSIENIHKVIDPLFLNELREKLNEAEAYKNEKTRIEKLTEFQNYIARLKFFDPACGSGNFLTETYLSLRRLENEALEAMSHGMMMLDMDGIIKVSIQQFYGIEINDFAVKVAKTALWIAEAQMWNETKQIISTMSNIEDFLPLETYDNIKEGNALRMDWNEVIPNTECNYIMGNPPFIGANNQTKDNREDMKFVFGEKFNSIGLLDYVTAWYRKSYIYIKDTSIECAFVSTNSISQGEQPALVWEDLMKDGITINFAYRTFIWDSEANLKAHVHCVIVGFSMNNHKEKYIFENGRMIKTDKINAYLLPADNVFINRRENPWYGYPHIGVGNMPYDGGYLLLTEEEKQELVASEPQSSKWIKKVIGAKEFLQNIDRYCLWLKDCSPSELKSMPNVLKRVSLVRDARLNMKDKGAHKLANTPTVFREQRNPKKALVIPKVSSERRRYIPIDIVDDSVIIIDSLQMIPDGDLYLLGLLESNVHMSWVRSVCGRLKSDYRYSAKIVYNNFPWPNPTKEQKERIEKTAQMILDTRAKYPNSSLADLYDELTMPSDLRTAHQLNDKAVMDAYGFSIKMTESECVAKLMEMYEKLVSESSN